jgi:hypothetical protein
MDLFSSLPRACILFDFAMELDRFRMAPHAIACGYANFLPYSVVQHERSQRSEEDSFLYLLFRANTLKNAEYSQRLHRLP